MRGVVPTEIPASGGFLVSPTTLEDPTFPVSDQRRYVEPLTIATAVIPSNGALRPFGVVPGTLGVAWRKQKGIASSASRPASTFETARARRRWRGGSPG